MPDFRLPDLGEGVTEGEIDRWLVKEGDVVEEDTPLVEVITDKATAEIPSPYSGTVLKIHHAEGEVVPVGNVMITIGDPSETTQRDDLVDTAATQTEVPERAHASAPPPPPPSGASAATEVRERVTAEGNGKVKAMPPVRRLARDLGVDLASVTGSGPDGRILREDVEAAAESPAPSVPRPARRGEQRVPIRGVRRLIAERMAEAHRMIPPVTHVEECDVTELDVARRKLNERYPDHPKLSYLPFIITATVRALKEYPELNSSLDDDAQEIVYYDHYDIGVATDTPQGLVVPVVRDADQKSLHELAADLHRLAAAGRDGKLKPEELRGGTFTITSPGKFAGLVATPIIMYPQAAILGVHRATERPWVVDGRIEVRKIMNIGVTFDHRVMDGMSAAKFNQEIVALLEHPAVLLYEP